MIIDSHIHLWRRADGDDNWLVGKIGGLTRDFTEQDWERNAASCGVAGAVLVQAIHAPAETLRWLGRAEALPWMRGVVGWADLHGDSLADDVARFKTHRKFVGIRPLPHGTFGADWLAHPRTRRGLDVLRQADVTVDVLVKWPGLKAATALLADHQDMRIVLNHCGRPDTMTGQLEPWASDLRALARATTAVVKCSGLIERAGIEWTKEALKPYVATVIDAFGPKRVMFATNWPVLEVGGTYAGWVRTFQEIVDELGISAADKAQMLAATATRAYGLAAA